MMTPSMVARELRRTADRIDKSSSPSRGRLAASIRGIMAHVAGQDWSHLEPLSAEDANSSQLLWHAMRELGMQEWQPDTNVDDVVEKMKELAASVGVQDAGEAVKYALDNFSTYHEHYNPEKPPAGEPIDR